MLPIFDHRTIVGYAKSAQQAQRIVCKMLQHVPKGWRVTVKKRDTSIIALPEGWIYSVHP